MDQYASSLARVCLELGGIPVFYEDNVPENFYIPSLYFPAPELIPEASALNSYQEKYSIYAKVFALTRKEAGELACKITRGIMGRQGMIPVYNEDGTDSGMSLKVEPPASRIVDEGLAQVTLSYKIIRAYAEVKHPAAAAVGINKKYD